MANIVKQSEAFFTAKYNFTNTISFKFFYIVNHLDSAQSHNLYKDNLRANFAFSGAPINTVNAVVITNIAELLH